MRHRSAGLLYDIRLSAQYIMEDTADENYESFLANRPMRQVVERNLLIIGEAVNRLQRHAPGTAAGLSAIPQIVGMRNILAHEYEAVNYETVWRTVQLSIPTIFAEADALLKCVTEGEVEFHS